VVAGFADGGAYWFVDLGAADPTYILPGVVTATFLAVTEVGMDGIQMDKGAQMKIFMRVLPLLFLPITAAMPAGCLVYWCSSNAFSVVQTLLLRNKALKKRFQIPDLPQPVTIASKP
jgi:YidC/Oxa1 family membrane protein insertase